ncbi:hypothetical protein MHM582_3284 [Microbacterium sp. HM58-2]|nr:hypothetical protein MHM582_3284 [Microbacterium sp. HM58-2]
MSAAQVERRRNATFPGARLGLLGLAVGIGWLLLTLFTGGSSASADTADGQEGLLGSVVGSVAQTTQTVTNTTQTVTQTAAAVVQTASAPVQQTVQAVQPAVAAASQVAPVAPAATPVVSTVAQVATQVMTAVPDVTTAVVETAADLAGSVQVGTVVAPVADLVDTVVGGTAEIPVVGEVVDELLGATTPGDVIDSIAGDVDSTVDDLLGDTTTGIVRGPQPSDDQVSAANPAAGEDSALSLPAATAAVSLSGSAGHELASADSASSAPGGGLGAPVAPAPGRSGVPAATAPGGSGPGGALNGGGSAGASSVSDAVLSAYGHGAAASLVLGTVSDELPSSPVFDTDSTPD